jgi:hypothetical protein
MVAPLLAVIARFVAVIARFVAIVAPVVAIVALVVAIVALVVAMVALVVAVVALVVAMVATWAETLEYAPSLVERKSRSLCVAPTELTRTVQAVQPRLLARPVQQPRAVSLRGFSRTGVFDLATEPSGEYADVR